MIRMFNSGAGTVTTTVGRLNPGQYLDVPDIEAKRLMGMYSYLKDAEVMIGKATVAAPEPKVPKSTPQPTTEAVNASVKVRIKKSVKRKKR